jgi:putative oxygen-independent coproporphyrinogen III oxidase
MPDSAPVARPGLPPLKPRSAYLHIPFCHRRCFYCDFAVVPLGDRADGGGGPGSTSIEAYLTLLRREIYESPSGPPLSTVYLGGGTPSLLTPSQVGALLETLTERYGLAPGAEISLEMDPASFDEARLHGYLARGVNRVSLGGQSFEDGVLADLGRRHRRADLLEAAGWLRRAQARGMLHSWSLDLIQALPGQELRSWSDQLEQALSLAPPHLSIYDLIVEPGTVFERRQRRGQLDLPEEDTAADLMLHTGQRLAQAGYGHYEVSNYALPGHASVRQARPRTREAYGAWLTEQTLRHDAETQAGSEPQGRGIATTEPGPAWEDLWLVGLRRREGVNAEELFARVGLGPQALADLRRRLKPFEQGGLLRIEAPRWRLSAPEGLALSNAVLRELLLWWEEQAPTAC